MPGHASSKRTCWTLARETRGASRGHVACRTLQTRSLLIWTCTVAVLSGPCALLRSWFCAAATESEKTDRRRKRSLALDKAFGGRMVLNDTSAVAPMSILRRCSRERGPSCTLPWASPGPILGRRIRRGPPPPRPHGRGAHALAPSMLQNVTEYAPYAITSEPDRTVCATSADLWNWNCSSTFCQNDRWAYQHGCKDQDVSASRQTGCSIGTRGYRGRETCQPPERTRTFWPPFR